MILDALKKRMYDAANTKGGKWIKELPNALWGLRTQPTTPTGQSPYFLVYGSKVVLPTDVMWRSPTVDQYEEGVAKETRQQMSTVSRKLAATHLFNPLDTLRGFAAIMTAMLRNAPSTLVI